MLLYQLLFSLNTFEMLMSMAGTATTTLFTSLTQQSYLVKMDLDSSIVFCENPVFMSVRVVVIPLDITTTWMDIKTGFSRKNTELSKSVFAR